MADALCGPSNPLQSLRKHTQVDRTLQQDRLVQQQSRQLAAAEQFRSHDPRTGALDAALNAFEHAAPLDLHYQDPSHDPLGWQRHPHLHPHPHPQPVVVAGGGGGGWAADFQKLHISQTAASPVPVSQFRTEAPLVTSTHAGWHNDFLLQQQSGGGGGGGGGVVSLKGKEAATATTAAAATNGFSYDYRHQPETFLAPQHQSNGLAMQSGGGFMADQHQHQQQEQQQQQQWENVSSEAFEEAFQDAIVSEAEAKVAVLQQLYSHIEESVDLLEQQQQQLLEAAKIGSDAIPYTEVQNRTADQDRRDADELARTAGQLVEMMKDESETNRKFRESEFLGLMRRLRDREVEVRDNEMVETSNTITSATATTTTPAAAAATTIASSSALDGGNVEQHQELMQTEATEEENNVTTPTIATDQYDWAFPDMNDIYAPTNNDLDTASRSYSPFFESASDTVGTASTSQPQASLLGPDVSRDELYHSGSDEFPDHQQELHPGGKWYPEQQQQQQQQTSPEVVMSGAVTPDATPANGGSEAAVKASDFDNGDIEESGYLARRFSASRPRSLSVSAALRRLA